MAPVSGSRPKVDRSMHKTGRRGKKNLVVVHDKMQRNYRYERVAAIGRGFDPEFTPELTPKQMLALGVFGGKYMTDCRREFPDSWFARAKLSRRDEIANAIILASKPVNRWRCGRRKAGFTSRIRVAGFNGIAATIW